MDTFGKATTTFEDHDLVKLRNRIHSPGT
jgi:hypothetical protein